MLGLWGNGLYDNDTALDIKDTVEDMLRDKKNINVITDSLITEYKSIMGDFEEESAFWFSLADAQWNNGVLLPSVKEKALIWIENVYAELTKFDPTDAKQKKKMLDKLYEKLNSPQPPVKKYRRRRIYKCEWNFGDVFAYRLESELAKERGLFGRYFLIRKVDETTWYPGHIIPIVYVKITNDDQIPRNTEEYNKSEYVQVAFTKFENRFNPINMRNPREDIAQKMKINYIVDEYGYLPEYRCEIVTTSKNAIPKNLIFVGNFTDVILPKNEFIPHHKCSIRHINWKKFDDTFESVLIQTYFNHNRRELGIYR